MKFSVTKNGKLLIESESEDKDMLEDAKRRCGENDISFMAELLEETGWQANSRLMQVNPEDIGALTDAPILSDDVRYKDDGSVEVMGNVWWLPDYMVRNFADDLIEHGKVSFEPAPENKPQKVVDAGNFKDRMKVRIARFKEEENQAKQKGLVILPSVNGPYAYNSATDLLVGRKGSEAYRKATSASQTDVKEAAPAKTKAAKSKGQGPKFG